MRCAKLRQIIVFVPAEQRTAYQQEAVEQHLAECPQCARFAREMASLEDCLQNLPARPAPDDFALAVRYRIELKRRKPKVSWWERVFGVQRAAAPLVSPRLALGTASVAAVALAVGLFVGLPHSTSSLVPPDSRSAAAGASVEAPLPVRAEIMLRHRRYSASLALADDPGINLLSYSPGDR